MLLVCDTPQRGGTLLTALIIIRALSLPDQVCNVTSGGSNANSSACHAYTVVTTDYIGQPPQLVNVSALHLNHGDVYFGNVSWCNQVCARVNGGSLHLRGFVGALLSAHLSLCVCCVCCVCAVCVLCACCVYPTGGPLLIHGVADDVR